MQWCVVQFVDVAGSVWVLYIGPVGRCGFKCVNTIFFSVIKS